LFGEKNISSSLDRSETTKRQKLAKKFERLTLLLLSSGIKTASGREESVQNPEWVEGEVDSRGALSEVSDQQLANLAPQMGIGDTGYDVNVAGVRVISQRRRIREHPHAEFIVCTKRLGKDDVYVARRYGAFKRLHHEVFSSTKLSDSSYEKNSLVKIFHVSPPRTDHPHLYLE
jgi:hypothetical protein